MEGRTGLPVSGTPPFASPVPPPHGTVPAPVVSSDTVLSPVFADLPAGPTVGTRTSTASSSAGIASPGHANYQGKLFSSSVAALGGGSGFSYLGNYISPSSTDSFKHSTSIPQPVNMNQYWLSSTEGYAGYPVGSTHHPYPPYFTALNSLSSSGTQGLLAVSANAKSDGQRFPASHQTRNAEGLSTKVNKMSPHGLKESTTSPKTSTHQAGKSRHTSGSDDRRAFKHDSSRNRNREKDKDVVLEEKKESPVNRSNKVISKDKGNEISQKHEHKFESDLNKDTHSKKSDKLPESKQSIQSNPLTVTVEVNNTEDPLNSVPKCNGKVVQSPKKEATNANSSLSALSPKSKDSSSEKRRKASKKKDIPVDVNGNAVLNVSVEKKTVQQTSTVVCESRKLLTSWVKPSVLEEHHVKGAVGVSTHQLRLPEGVDKVQPNLTNVSTHDNNWTSATSVVAMPLVSSAYSSLVPSSDNKLSPSSVLSKVTSPTSTPQSSSPLGDPTSPSGANTCGIVSLGNSSPGVICSTSPGGNSIQGTYSLGNNPTTGANLLKLNPARDTLTIVGSPGTLETEVNHPTRASLLGVGLVASNATTSSPTADNPNLMGDNPTVSNHANANPTRSSPTRTNSLGGISGEANVPGANSAGASPTGANYTGVYPTGANPTGANHTGANPTGANPTGANPTGANPMGANSIGANPTRLSPSGSKPSRSSPSFSSSVCSPHYVISGESSCEGSFEKEKLPSPRSLFSSAALSTCVTSSASKPISFPAHGSLPHHLPSRLTSVTSRYTSTVRDISAWRGKWGERHPETAPKSTPLRSYRPSESSYLDQHQVQRFQSRNRKQKLR